MQQVLAQPLPRRIALMVQEALSADMAPMPNIKLFLVQHGVNKPLIPNQ